jgi:hypothetical protein
MDEDKVPNIDGVQKSNTAEGSSGSREGEDTYIRSNFQKSLQGTRPAP